jgi:SAM-dependent methyltransferase
MSYPSKESPVPDAIEQNVKQKLITHFTRFYGERVESHVNTILSFDSHMGRLNYLKNKVGHEVFSSTSSILISGFSVGSEMIAAKQYGFGEIHGVEVSRFYYEVCQERIGYIPGMHPQLYDGSYLPYEDEKFAVVISSHVVEHTASPELYVQEGMRVLIPGGYFLIEFPHRYHPIELHTGVVSFEWMPHPVRNLMLKILSGRFSPLDAKKKKGYNSILITNLQQMSMIRIKRALKKQNIPYTIVDKTQWKPGVVRCIIKKPAGIKMKQASKIKETVQNTIEQLQMNTYEHRKSVFVNSINIKNHNGLEIGPLDKPIVTKKDGPIKYLDYMSKEELIARHSNAVDPNNVVEVDYVNDSHKTLSETIQEQFDYVIACHVIEHIPNMIAWLNDVYKILKDGGYLYLAIPDKRYTFDIVRPVTPLAHFINDYYQNVKTANFDHVFEHIYLKRNVKSGDVWNNRVADKINVKRFSAEEAYQRTLYEMEPGKYPDVHCHVFISQGFLDIINTLIEMKLIAYTVYKFEDVSKPYNEFILILKKQQSDAPSPANRPNDPKTYWISS